MTATPREKEAMRRALSLAWRARTISPPNPWVGAVVLTRQGCFHGHTQRPGGPHAEIVALRQAGMRASGSTLVTTLEPCSHTGRTPPCTEAILKAGIKRVVIGLEDPDPKVSGSGIARLRDAGLEVVAGVLAEEVRSQLAPYIVHRSMGRPYVVLKLAATLDGRIAAPDGSSKWITGPVARADVARLRAESDAILVGAGTLAHDDPSLRVHFENVDKETMKPWGVTAGDLEATQRRVRQPLRLVAGAIPPKARCQPAESLAVASRGSGSHEDEEDLQAWREALSALAKRGILQLLCEGGAKLAWSLHRARLVDRYVVYTAPRLMGGADGKALMEGPGASALRLALRGNFSSVVRLGDDLRIDFIPGQVQAQEQ